MILNRIEPGTECTIRESGSKGILKKIYFYPTKFEIEFEDGKIDHYSSKDVVFDGISQKSVSRKTLEAPEFGTLEKWSGGTLTDSESLIRYHFSTTKDIMWKMLTSLETYNVWFYGIQRSLPVLETDRYVHKYSFNQLELIPGSYFKIRPRTVAPYFICRIMTIEKEKEFGFTFQTTPFTNEYVHFSIEETKFGVIVSCHRNSSGGLSILNQMNWKEKSQIFNHLNEIVPKVDFNDNLVSDDLSNISGAGSSAQNISPDDIVAILVNKVLDGDAEEMTKEKSKVIRGKAKAMIVKIKRGTVERPPMPEVPTASAEVNSAGGVDALSKDDQVAYLVNKGMDGDMDTVNNFESKVVRAKAKAMIVKIKRGTVERPPMPEVPTAGVLPKEKTSAETDEELMARLISSGLEGNMDEINSLENRVLRGKIKAAIMKEKRKNNG